MSCTGKMCPLITGQARFYIAFFVGTVNWTKRAGGEKVAFVILMNTMADSPTTFRLISWKKTRARYSTRLNVCVFGAPAIHDALLRLFHSCPRLFPLPHCLQHFFFDTLNIHRTALSIRLASVTPGTAGSGRGFDLISG